MSAPIKKRAMQVEGNSNEERSSSDDISEEDEAQEYTGQEEIQVDFEGRNPIDSDFHGIKQLLQQLFLKAHINLSELTDLIITQNYVGSVIKQSDVEEDSGDEDDDDDVANQVFGVTTVVNLTDKQNQECVQQLRQLLVELCREHGTDQSNALVNNLLANDAQPVGLLVNERFVNIPAQICVPLFESLSKEMKRAKEKNHSFDFAYYIVICKLYKMDNESSKKKKKSGKNKTPVTQESEILWSNPEEELFDQEAECRFEFCVKSESDSGMTGRWLEDDDAMIPYRRILILPAHKFDPLIQRVKEYVSG